MYRYISFQSVKILLQWKRTLYEGKIKSNTSFWFYQFKQFNLENIKYMYLNVKKKPNSSVDKVLLTRFRVHCIFLSQEFDSISIAENPL